MSDGRESLRASSLIMKITGWGIIVGSIVGIVYPPGFYGDSIPRVFHLFVGSIHPRLMTVCTLMFL